MHSIKPPRELVLEKLRTVAAQESRIHVIPDHGRWAVKREDLTRASRVLDDRTQAIKLARKLAQERSMDVVVHARDGSVQKQEIFSR